MTFRDKTTGQLMIVVTVGKSGTVDGTYYNWDNGPTIPDVALQACLSTIDHIHERQKREDSQ